MHLEIIASALLQKEKISYCFLHGSYARGDQLKNSDLDILIVYEIETIFDHNQILFSNHLQELGYKTDIRHMPMESFNLKLQKNDPFILHCILEGKLLIGRYNKEWEISKLKGRYYKKGKVLKFNGKIPKQNLLSSHKRYKLYSDHVKTFNEVTAKIYFSFWRTMSLYFFSEAYSSINFSHNRNLLLLKLFGFSENEIQKINILFSVRNLKDQIVPHRKLIESILNRVYNLILMEKQDSKKIEPIILEVCKYLDEQISVFETPIKKSPKKLYEGVPLLLKDLLLICKSQEENNEIIKLLSSIQDNLSSSKNQGPYSDHFSTGFFSLFFLYPRILEEYVHLLKEKSEVKRVLQNIQKIKFEKFVIEESIHHNCIILLKDKVDTNLEANLNLLAGKLTFLDLKGFYIKINKQEDYLHIEFFWEKQTNIVFSILIYNLIYYHYANFDNFSKDRFYAFTETKSKLINPNKTYYHNIWELNYNVDFNSWHGSKSKSNVFEYEKTNGFGLSYSKFGMLLENNEYTTDFRKNLILIAYEYLKLNKNLANILSKAIRLHKEYTVNTKNVSLKMFKELENEILTIPYQSQSKDSITGRIQSQIFENLVKEDEKRIKHFYKNSLKPLQTNLEETESGKLKTRGIRLTRRLLELGIVATVTTAVSTFAVLLINRAFP